MKVSEKTRTILYFLLYLILIFLSLKYFFGKVSNYDEHIIKIRGNMTYFWQIIIFEVVFTGIFYRYMPNEKFKDYLIVLLFSVFVITIGLYVGIHQLRGLPTGDHRFYVAQSESVLAGHWPWEDPFYKGELNTYPYLYFAIVAIFYSLLSIFFNISLGKLYILMVLVNKAIFPFVMYWAGRRLFNRWIGLLSSFFSITFIEYWGGPHWPAVMLSVVALVWFYEDKYLKSGLTLSIIILTYTYEAVLTLVTMVCYRLLSIFVKRDETASKHFKILGKTFLVTALICTPFILPLYLKYNLVLKIPVSLIEPPMTQINFNVFSYLGKVLIIGFLISIFKREKNNLLVVSYFISWFLLFHHYLLSSITGVILVQLMRERALQPVKILLISIFYYTSFSLLYKFSKNKIQNMRKETLLNACTLLLIVFYLPSIGNFANSYPSYWDTHWSRPDDEGMLRTMNWINNNTNPDDVILSDYGYASDYIVPYTGRKVVFVQPNYHNTFVDFEQRMSDYNYMYYGSNFTKIKELLVKYNVKYIMDSRNTYWGESENKTLIPFDFSKHEEFKLRTPWDIWGIYEFIPTSTEPFDNEKP